MHSGALNGNVASFERGNVVEISILQNYSAYEKEQEVKI